MPLSDHIILELTGHPYKQLRREWFPLAGQWIIQKAAFSDRIPGAHVRYNGQDEEGYLYFSRNHYNIAQWVWNPAQKKQYFSRPLCLVHSRSGSLGQHGWQIRVSLHACLQWPARHQEDTQGLIHDFPQITLQILQPSARGQHSHSYLRSLHD